MRICYLFSNLQFAEITAEPKMALRLAHFARDEGHSVFIVSNHKKEKQEIKGNIQFFLLNGLGNIKTYLLNIHKVTRYLLTVNPDILHVQGGLIIIYAWLINIILKKPLFFTLFESFDSFHGLAKKLLLFCLKGTRKIFVISDYFKNQLTTAGINANKIFVVRIGLEEKFLKQQPLKKYDWDLFFFGDSSMERGFDLVHQLTKKMPENSFRILLRWKKNCRKELAEMKKFTNVRFVNITDRQSLIQMIYRSKIILLPFRRMGVRPPLSIVEAMALEKCVVTSNMTGNEEVIKHNQSGFLLNFTDLDETVRFLKNLLADTKRLSQIGSAAGKAMRSLYTSNEYIKIINAYVRTKTKKTA